MTLVLAEADRAELRERLFRLYQATFSSIAIDRAHIGQMVEDSLDEARSTATLDLVRTAIGRDLNGLRTLEIGAGVGLGVAVATRRFGADAVGVEPGSDEYSGTLETAHDILRRAGLPETAVLNAVGEALPFPDAAFDVIYSSNVLEHVDDPQRVIDETVRTLKPGGHMVIVVPNYGSWWEGHYGFLWLPHMPLWLAKTYVRLRRRDPSFLDTLNFVSAGHLRRWLRPHTQDLEVLDWGKDLFRHRMATLGFAEYGALSRLKQTLRLLHRLGLVGLITNLAMLFNWQTPIVLVARKRARPEP